MTSLTEIGGMRGKRKFVGGAQVRVGGGGRSVIIAPTLDGIHFLAPTNRPSFLPPPPLLSFLYFFASPVVLYLHGTDRVSE